MVQIRQVVSLHLPSHIFTEILNLPLCISEAFSCQTLIDQIQYTTIQTEMNKTFY